MICIVTLFIITINRFVIPSRSRSHNTCRLEIAYSEHISVESLTKRYMYIKISALHDKISFSLFVVHLCAHLRGISDY